MVRYAFIASCGFIVGALLVEYKDYLTQQIPTPMAILPDGGLYDGEFRKGIIGGKGRVTWADQRYYEGDFREGLFHGEGILHTPNYLYQGEFYQGNASGSGRIDYLYGDNYHGEVRFGLPNGYGVLEKANGDVYQGEFANGFYDGQGELTQADGALYIGQFKQGVFHGEGTFTQTSNPQKANADSDTNTIYRGTFVKGELTGKGVRVYGDQRFEGDFVNWQFSGQGTYTDSQGTYTGEFSQGLFHGKGTYVAADGTHYEGEFISGLYHGQGTLTEPSNDIYSGSFKYGQKHGKGRLTYHEALDGIEFVKGTWAYDRLVKANHPRLAVADETLVEHAIYHQSQMLSNHLNTLVDENPEKIDLYFVGVAGDGKQGVFRREVAFVKTVFDEHYFTQNKSITLVNSPLTYDVNPLATVTSIEYTLQEVAKKMDKDKDILFLYLTSHGSREFSLELSQPGLSLQPLSADKLGAILSSLPVRHKVVMISACFSGGFVGPIKDDQMLVITAASADKTSFGCSDRAQMTYFGEAFFKDSLLQSSSFVEAFYRARDIVKGREAKEGIENSSPLIFKPTAIVKQLASWRKQIAEDKKQAQLTSSLYGN